MTHGGILTMGDNIDIEHAERLATLEQMAIEGKRDRERIEASVEEMRTDFAEIMGAMHTLREELAKYRGFWGGCLLVISALWAFVQLTGDWLVAKFKGEG